LVDPRLRVGVGGGEEEEEEWVVVEEEAAAAGAAATGPRPEGARAIDAGAISGGLLRGM